MTHFFCRWLAHAWGSPRRPEVVCHEARPPWAIDESQFLTLCTRCGDCFKACPNGLIKPADRPEYDGSPITGTPVLDLALTIPSYERGVARLLRYDRHP